MSHLSIHVPKIIVLQVESGENDNIKKIKKLYSDLSCTYSIYIMISSTSAPCCIDFISASRVKADLIVKFGPTCSSFLSSSETSIFIISDKCQRNQYLLFNDDCNNDIVSLFPLSANNDKIIRNDNQNSNQNNENRNKFENNENENFLALEDSFFPPLSSQNMKLIIFFELCKKYKKNPLAPTNINRLLSQRQLWISRASKCQKFGLILGQSDNPILNEKLNIALNLINIGWSRFASVIHISKINPAKLANMVQFDAFVIIGCPLLKLNQSDYNNDIPIVYYDELLYVIKGDELSFIQDFLDMKLINPKNVKYSSGSLSFSHFDSNIELEGDGNDNEEDDKKEKNDSDHDKNHAISQRIDYHLIEKSNIGMECSTFKGLEFDDKTRNWNIGMGQDGIPRNYKFIK